MFKILKYYIVLKYLEIVFLDVFKCVFLLFILMGLIFVVMCNMVDGFIYNIYKEINGDREMIYNFYILYYVKKKIFWMYLLRKRIYSILNCNLINMI